MKRSNGKRHRPEQVVAKLRQADEALANGTSIGEAAGCVHGEAAPVVGQVRSGGPG
jgi:hypothetical protein